MPKGGTKRKLSELEDEGAVTREQENKEDDGETLKTPRQGLPLPKGVCVKVQYLRPRYTSLEEWTKDKGHQLLTRHGRVFVGSGPTRHIFTYPNSKWANPFKLSEYSLKTSLAKYEQHLDLMLKDPDVKREFLTLAKKKELGCFCDPGTNNCHRDVVIKKLKELTTAQAQQHSKEEQEEE